MQEVRDKIETAPTEFPNKIDFCVSANIPVPPVDIVFFRKTIPIMVGPVPMTLSK
ncbi:hypothetical protein DPMN_125645 [Dreissena polymorpha]|uniref:Uncharacterized protein n=1 Tax=Dreissena polymorpha TaxID=45954 RepID=A0A9D4JX95_DREPO|nr:hypothetical protein DPMN_125645 [Dreissena polymorpha]